MCLIFVFKWFFFFFVLVNFVNKVRNNNVGWNRFWWLNEWCFCFGMVFFDNISELKSLWNLCLIWDKVSVLLELIICVSIGWGWYCMMFVEFEYFVKVGVKLVELCLDYICCLVNMKWLLEEKFCEVIVICCRLVDGGKWCGMEVDWVVLFCMVIVEGIDFVDFEVDVVEKIWCYGLIKWIVSYYNF